MNISNGKSHGHVDHVQHVSQVQYFEPVQHVEHIQHVDLVHHVSRARHVGQPKHPEGNIDDNINIKSGNKSGDEVPFIILIIFRLMVRLIKAFPVKMELHIVDGYVYRYKRAAGGAAQFLNYFGTQLAQYIGHILQGDRGWRVGMGLGVVRVIKSVNGKILCELVRVGRGMIVWIRVCEVVWVVGWVRGVVKTIFFRLGKSSVGSVNASISSGSTGMTIASIVSKPLIIISQLNLVCQIISNQITNFYISTSIMLSLTIYLALLCQNVESNPGPRTSKAPSLSVLTYNCNGLGDPKKLKRLLLKLNGMVDRGCIVFLQETHIVNTKYLEMIWKHNVLSNCVKTDSAGVIILYNKKV